MASTNNEGLLLLRMQEPYVNAAFQNDCEKKF